MILQYKLNHQMLKDASGSKKILPQHVIQSLYKEIKKKNPSTCFIDGDKIRQINDNDLGYTLSDRKKNAKRIINFCKLLDDQKINVVVSILHNFPKKSNIFYDLEPTTTLWPRIYVGVRQFRCAGKSFTGTLRRESPTCTQMSHVHFGEDHRRQNPNH